MIILSSCTMYKPNIPPAYIFVLQCTLFANMDIWLHRETKMPLLIWISKKYCWLRKIMYNMLRNFSGCMYLCSYRNVHMYMYLCKYRNTVADRAMLTLDSHNYCRAPPRHATIWSLGAGHQVEVHSLFDFLCFKFPYYCPVEIYYQYQYHLIPLSWTPSGSALSFHLF